MNAATQHPLCAACEFRPATFRIVDRSDATGPGGDLRCDYCSLNSAATFEPLEAEDAPTQHPSPVDVPPHLRGAISPRGR
jgi:hypothetical protein